MEEIRERQSKRFLVLKRLYDAHHTTETAWQPVSTKEIGSEIGLSEQETLQIMMYLEKEGLIQAYADGGDTARITHAGVVEIEHALSLPALPTEHFFPNVVQYIVNARQIVNSPIQQGTIDSSMTISSQDVAREIQGLIELLKPILAELPIDTRGRAEVEAEVDTVTAQLKSPRPKRNIIKASLETIRRILQAIPANLIANLIAANLQNVPQLIEKLTLLIQRL